jgi:hypothetical protein
MDDNNNTEMDDEILFDSTTAASNFGDGDNDNQQIIGLQSSSNSRELDGKLLFIVKF